MNTACPLFIVISLLSPFSNVKRTFPVVTGFELLSTTIALRFTFLPIMSLYGVSTVNVTVSLATSNIFAVDSLFSK